MLMYKTDFLQKNPHFQSLLLEGMRVRSRDGKNLGKITQLSDDSITMEKGFFFPKDFIARYSDIQDIHDDTVYLNLTEEELSPWRDDSYQGWSQTEAINSGRLSVLPNEEYRDEYVDRFPQADSEEVHVPVSEEELKATKTLRQTGEIKLQKVVHTELKHFTIPVMKEEVRVERVPNLDSIASAESRNKDDLFKEKTFSVPVMEEEVIISKRPVTKEEVRVTKERVTEEREVSDNVRKETVEIKEEGRVPKKKVG